MAAVDSIRAGASNALRLGRGLADRAIRVTGPPIARTVSRLVARVPTRRTPPAPAGGTSTFTPARSKVEPGVQPPAHPPADSTAPRPVTPSTVARNIGPPRPVARASTVGRPARKSVPGAKLPPPRPSVSS